MESYEKLYNCICRLCLTYTKSDNLIPLFDNSGKVNYYGKAVTTFASILFRKEDCLPPSMCKKCLILLKQCIYFKFMCESSDRQLKRLKSLATDNFKQRIVEYTLFKLKNIINYSTDTAKNVPQPTLMKKKPEFINIAPKKDINNHDKKNVMSNCFFEIEIECVSATPKIEPKEIESENPDEILDSLEQSELPNKDLNTEILAIKPKRKLRRKVKRRFIKNVNKSIKKRNYVCNICNKILANQQTYVNHLQRHNGCRFICEHCGKGFPVLRELQYHQLLKHDIGPYIQCPQCPFKAPRKFDLTEHERIHSGERPFTCEKCGLTFRRRYIYKKHLIYHTEKKIQCTLCTKKFFMQSHMMDHYNNVHERMYMYVCGKCDVMYAKADTVRRHMIHKHGIPREMQGKILRIKKGGGFRLKEG